MVGNEKGEERIPFQYDFADDFSEGMAAVKRNEKYGYINSSGKLLIPFTYVHGGPFKKGKARVILEKRTFYIDRSGREVGVE